jgi:hypothetical protein
MKKNFLAAAFVLFGTILTGCAGGYRYNYGYAGYGPPAPRYRAIGVAPGPGYVWVNGYWGWRGSRYEWNEGRWDRPPRGRTAWVDGNWRHEGRGWRYREGHWR